MTEFITGFGPANLAVPINKLKSEHAIARQFMRGIRNLTNNYTQPANACNTHRFCLAELKALEVDLPLHVNSKMTSFSKSFGNASIVAYNPKQVNSCMQTLTL